MKKIVLLFLAVMFLLFAACSNNNEEADASHNLNNNESTNEENNGENNENEGNGNENEEADATENEENNEEEVVEDVSIPVTYSEEVKDHEHFAFFQDFITNYYGDGSYSEKEIARKRALFEPHTNNSAGHFDAFINAATDTITLHQYDVRQVFYFDNVNHYVVVVDEYVTYPSSFHGEIEMIAELRFTFTDDLEPVEIHPWNYHHE